MFTLKTVFNFSNYKWITVIAKPQVFYSTTITEIKANVNGFALNCVQTSSGRNAVVCLPGALGSVWTDFKPQIEKLPALLTDMSVIAWDPPGYGASRPPKRDFVNFYEKDADLAHSLMNVLGYKTYSILGWSDGGISGMIMAAKYQKSVNKLIIWGSNSYITSEEANIYKNIRDIQKWSVKMREPLEKMYGAEYFKTTWENWVDTLVGIYNHQNGDICKGSLPNIVCPTLILHGAKDPMVAAEHLPHLLENIENSISHVFPEGKHNIHLRYADEFNNVIAAFLNKQKQ